MKHWRLRLLLLVIPSLFLAAQQEERLWMPEGYRLLTIEEHKALPPEEVKAIGQRNSDLLLQAVRAMSPAERQRVQESLERSSRNPELTQVEKHYVTMASMVFLGVPMEEQDRAQKEEQKRKFEKLLRDQEETTKGFPGDQKSVSAEANAVEPLIGREEAYGLYLRILRPLRARPWNHEARLMFRRIVRANSHSRPGVPNLLDAGLAFVRAREAENPNEGAWYSQEAVLRLCLRNEVTEAKKLFPLAAAKNSRDIDSRLFPLLLAEIEQNKEEVARLLPRARVDWRDQADLEKALYNGLAALPAELQAKAKTTFEVKYKKAHPTDWEARHGILTRRLREKHFQDVEHETASLLALPVSAFPEPHRTDFFALNLRARAWLGRCGEIERQLPVLQSRAEASHPRRFDSDMPPTPRTAADVKAARLEIERSRKTRAELRKSLETGFFQKAPEWKDVPLPERKALIEEFLRRLDKEIAAASELVIGKEDSVAAAEWSRKELEEWEKEHGISPKSFEYDIAPRADRLEISVRSATGQCFLEKGDSLAAARLLTPCIGAGRNIHRACLQPLIDAGEALAKNGNLPEAIAIYNLAAGTPVSVYDLFEAIEKAAPGSVKRKPPESVRVVPPQ